MIGTLIYHNELYEITIHTDNGAKHAQTGSIVGGFMRCILFSLAFCMFVLGVAIWLIYPTDRTLASWTETLPASKVDGRYELVLIERDLQLFYGPFERRHELRIRNKANDEVAHIVPIELFGEARTRECQSTCEVNWVEKGVEFSQSSGHKLFIPASAYEGGR